ncbi:hypothetical protein [Streptomyces sp. NPDC008150]|uniref:hypothetical protein n=1 Tax=Streptomyces sp. NPDC008150 TaxID=3364816 RepID=UPI0036ED6FC3
MTCEPEPTRITWAVEQLEPYSGVMMQAAYGRATTPAALDDIARAALAAWLAYAHPDPAATNRTRITVHDDAGHKTTLGGQGLTAWLAEQDQGLPDALDGEACLVLPVYLHRALGCPEPAAVPGA